MIINIIINFIINRTEFKRNVCLATVTINILINQEWMNVLQGILVLKQTFVRNLQSFLFSRVFIFKSKTSRRKFHHIFIKKWLKLYIQTINVNSSTWEQELDEELNHPVSCNHLLSYHRSSAYLKIKEICISVYGYKFGLTACYLICPEPLNQ